MADFVIREAVSGDLPAIGALWAALVAHHQALGDDMPRASADGAARYQRRLRDRLDDPHARILVAEADDVVVGYVFGVVADMMPDVFEAEIGGMIADLYVAAAQRQRGIGRALVEAMRAWFAEQHVQYVEWYVAADNTEGLAFWRAIGGREIMLRMRVRSR